MLLRLFDLRSLTYRLLAGLLIFPSFCTTASDSAPLEPITIQLRWLHQFQFAGYYAAVYKGYYREKGLDVTIVQGSTNRLPVKEVLAGRAQYGEANSELLYSYLQGQPLVAIAAIFQHSPSVILTRADSGITNPHHLIGKRLMMAGGTDDVDFRAVLANEAVKESDIDIVPSSYNIQDLVSGKVDAFNGYLTNEVFYMQEKDVEASVIQPINYGVDFYSDIFFTSRAELKNHPQRVQAMREATLRGWQYAMDNQQEIIDLILADYSQAKSRAHLQYEADTMEGLILPTLVPIGTINPGRMQRMADTLARFGLVPMGKSLGDFIYDPDPTVKRKFFIQVVLVSSAALAIALFVVLYITRLNRRLSSEIQCRLEIEKRLENLAYYDSLTDLPNRRLLFDRLKQAMPLTQRRGTVLAILYLDLDGFKEINDQYGHTIGDRFLALVSQHMSACLRSSDTFARMGGDEFVALVTDLSSTTEAEDFVSRLIRAASAIYKVEEFTINTSVSIGVTYFPQKAELDQDELIRQADDAMYSAKAIGKNGFYVYSPATQTQAITE